MDLIERIVDFIGDCIAMFWFFIMIILPVLFYFYARILEDKEKIEKQIKIIVGNRLFYNRLLLIEKVIFRLQFCNPNTDWEEKVNNLLDGMIKEGKILVNGRNLIFKQQEKTEKSSIICG